MLNRRKIVFRVTTFLAALWLGASGCPAQNPVAFQTILRDKVGFSEMDLTALERGASPVKLLPSREKREVAVAGLVRVETTAEAFLQSFQENMARKNNPAILEIGAFSNPPLPDDLQNLTIDDRDIEDLRNCVVGSCKLKLSAMMIERLHGEVDWTASDYKTRATQIVKQMLADYVHDYVNKGDAALIQYSDKQNEIRVAEDQRQLIAASSYEALRAIDQGAKDSTKPDFEIVDSAIIWSKIKFGLKPVIAVNHITIYRAARDSGTRILIVSRQIYANHYFDSSLALTGFLIVPGETPKSYLFYENRSRLDGLQGIFGKIKRDMVEDKALETLASFLRQSQIGLQTQSLKVNDSAGPNQTARRWSGWRVGRLHVFVLLLWLAGFAFFLGLRAYGWKSISRSLPY